jgi:hypothetical protein
MTRVLVCGGREYGTRVTEEGYTVINTDEVSYLNTILDSLKTEFTDLVIIQGEARGADTLAKDWAIRNKVMTLSFPANWKQYGKSAGYRRNTQMLEEGKPDIVIAFPGGRGTEMMCEIAETAGITVRRVT